METRMRLKAFTSLKAHLSRSKRERAHGRAVFKKANTSPVSLQGEEGGHGCWGVTISQK